MSGALTNVLVVSGGGFQGLAVVKGLAATSGVRIVLADCYEHNVSGHFCDEVYRIPLVAEVEPFLTALIEICTAESIDLVIPSTDHELTVVSENRARIEATGARVAVSDAALLASLRDKRQLYRMLGAEGVPVLPEVDIRTASHGDLPLIGKPRLGWGGRDSIVLRSAPGLDALDRARVAETHVWQPYLSDFVEYSVDFAIGFDGAISERVVRARRATSGGFAVVTDIVDDSDVHEIAVDFARRVAGRGARGLFNIQVLRTSSRLVVSDVNPRVGTSLPASTAAGVNLPRFLCASLGAMRPTSRRQPRPTHVVRYLDEAVFDPAARIGFTGVVFDLDDTLVDQKVWMFGKLEGVWERFSAILPAREPFLEAALSAIEEGFRANLFDELARRLGLDDGARAEMIEVYRSVVPPIDGVVYADARPVIASLRRQGLRIGLLTDNPPASQWQKLRATGLDGAFDAIVMSRDAGGEKPAAVAYRAVAETLGLPVDELAMVGDNLYRDGVGAIRAGFATAFLVRRHGGFFNFHRGLLDRVTETSRVVPIASLRDLLWYVRSRS